MTRVAPLHLTWHECRATYLKLRGKSLADIAWDMKLDSCLKSKRQAELEAKTILKAAAAKLHEKW